MKTVSLLFVAVLVLGCDIEEGVSPEEIADGADFANAHELAGGELAPVESEAEHSGSDDIGQIPRESRAIGSCTYRYDTSYDFSGTGEKVNYSPSCTGSEERTGGGCNTDIGHDEHTWLTDSYPWTSDNWRCAIYHNSSDSGVDLVAYSMCCT